MSARRTFEGGRLKHLQPKDPALDFNEVARSNSDPDEYEPNTTPNPDIAPGKLISWSALQPIDDRHAQHKSSGDTDNPVTCIFHLFAVNVVE